jgi:hypothetical protein
VRVFTEGPVLQTLSTGVQMPSVGIKTGNTPSQHSRMRLVAGPAISDRLCRNRETRPAVADRVNSNSSISAVDRLAEPICALRKREDGDGIGIGMWGRASSELVANSFTGRGGKGEPRKLAPNGAYISRVW